MNVQDAILDVKDHALMCARMGVIAIVGLRVCNHAITIVIAVLDVIPNVLRDALPCVKVHASAIAMIHVMQPLHQKPLAARLIL